MKHARSIRGRLITIIARIEAAATLAGTNVVVHVVFANVRRSAELSRMTGIDTRGFKHSTSNQAIAHSMRQHGNEAIEVARGQRAINLDDFKKLPAIIRSGAYREAVTREFGPPRVEIHASIEGDRYVYIGEIRRGKRRIDMVTMWKR